MKKRNENGHIKVKLDIDFTALGNSYEAKSIFNAIIKHNGGGRSRRTASNFILDAYNAFDERIKDETLALIDTKNKVNYILDNYKITCEEELYFYIRNNATKLADELKTPYKRIIVLNFDDKGAEELFEKLAPLKLKQRSQVICKFAKQHLILSKDEAYLEQSTRRLLIEMMKLEKAAQTNNSADQILKETVEGLISFIPKRNDYVSTYTPSTYSFDKDAPANTSPIEELNRLLGNT